MSSDGKDLDPGRRELTPEERAAMRSRASELGRRLDEVKARNAPVERRNGARGRAYGEAFKIVADLVVGVVVGGGIGWVLDRQLGTRPWLLVVCLILGFAAGMSNVLRTARRMQAEAEPLQRAAKPIEDDEDDPPARGGTGSRKPGPG
jgi:ATP synthase protein I